MKWTSADYLPDTFKVYLVMLKSGQVTMGMYRNNSFHPTCYNWYTAGSIDSDKAISDLEWYEFRVVGEEVIAWHEMPTLEDIAGN